jgi:hypothetical protein
MKYPLQLESEVDIIYEVLLDKDWKAPEWRVMTMRGRWAPGEKKTVKK